MWEAPDLDPQQDGDVIEAIDLAIQEAAERLGVQRIAVERVMLREIECSLFVSARWEFERTAKHVSPETWRGLQDNDNDKRLPGRPKLRVIRAERT